MVVPQLFQSDNLKKLSREKNVVVYGLGAGHAAQTQLLLSLKGYKAYSLREGISAWWENVTTPTSLRSATESPAGYQQARQLRAYFSGVAPAATGAAAPQVTPPPLPASQQPTAGKKQEKKLRLGGGCS